MSHALQHIWHFRPKHKMKAETSEALSCSLGEVLDPVNQVCRPLVCSYGYALQDGKCILTNTSYTSSDLLNSGLCGRFDALVIFRGPVLSSLCLQKHIIDRIGGDDAQAVHPKHFEQQASQDSHDYYIALLYEHVNK